MTKLPGSAFLSFPEMKNLLASELAERFNYGKVIAAPTISGSAFVKEKSAWYGDLLYSPQSLDASPYWASTVMEEPFIMTFSSIGEAARALKEIQRNWAPYSYQLFRRAALIQDKLPYINLKPRNFFKEDSGTLKKQFAAEIPSSMMGLYTLIDENTIIASAKTSSPLPAGLLTFAEDHVNPPSRAYLKLQESLALARRFLGAEIPGENSRCFEAGACPGGWTWVLRQLGADVLAVDRAPLAPSLMADSHVEFIAHDAFTLPAEEVCRKMNTERLDWVLSDVICYPKRLFEWVDMWVKSGRARNMICTIKMQGAVDWPLVQSFADIPGSKVVHLHYNKHELTWLYCAGAAI